MNTIWKYPVKSGQFELEIPKDAEILAVQTQRGEDPQMWVLVDDKAEKEVRKFEVYGTGHELPTELGKMFYIGTFQLAGGTLVFHLFELL